jgi:hypothetical protein
MKKFFLILLLIFPAESFCQDSYFQGLWPNLVNKEYNVNEPMFSNRIVSDVNLDHRYNSTNRKDEYNDTATVARLSSKIKLNKNFSLNGRFSLNRISTADEDGRRSASSDGGGDRAFENSGIAIRELNLSYAKKDVALVAGKFTPDFGTAWRWGRGIWSNDLANNYRQGEKLGLGGIYKMGDKQKTGRYNFGFSAFTNDRKNLDNSLINKRDSNHKYDAKPGDTRSLESYVASLDINFDFKNNEELSYHFAYLNLAVNERSSQVTPTKIDDQKGFVAGGKYRYPINDNFLFDGLLEYVDMKNVDGDSDINEKYFNASFVGEIYQNWNTTLAFANRKNVEIDQNGFDQNLSEISFGYKLNKNRFFDQLLLQVGYKNLRTNYKTSLDVQNSYGVLARYIKSF